MNYPKPQYGRIIPESERIVDGGITYNHKGYKIVEAYASYQLDPPMNGLSICTRPCWIVLNRGIRLMVVDGDVERVKREIELTKPASHDNIRLQDDELELEESSSSEDESEDENNENKTYEPENRDERPVNLHPKSRRRIGIQRRNR